MDSDAPPASAPGPSLFDGLVRWPWAATGLTVPVFLEELEAIGALLTADLAAVRALLPDPRLRPVEVAPGRCLFQVLAVDYRRGDFGRYHELACTVPVAIADAQPGAGGLAAFAPALDALARGLARSFTAWIWRMPVTTAQARDAGIALAGFPKEIADIRFGAQEAATTAALHGDSGELQVRLRLPDADAARYVHRPRDLRLRSVTMREGRPVTSLLRVRESRWRDLARPEGPVLTLGTGELADALRRLDLGERPWFAHHAAQAQAVLFPPRNLADD